MKKTSVSAFKTPATKRIISSPSEEPPSKKLRVSTPIVQDIPEQCMPPPAIPKQVDAISKHLTTPALSHVAKYVHNPTPMPPRVGFLSSAPRGLSPDHTELGGTLTGTHNGLFPTASSGVAQKSKFLATKKVYDNDSETPMEESESPLSQKMRKSSSLPKRSVNASTQQSVDNVEDSTQKSRRSQPCIILYAIFFVNISLLFFKVTKRKTTCTTLQQKKRRYNVEAQWKFRDRKSYIYYS